jgi:hypothetical protein
VVAIVSVQLDGPAPPGVTVRVGAASSGLPWREARPAWVMVGQLPVPVIFAVSPAVLSGPVMVTVCEVFAVACATVKSKLAGLPTSGAGVGLPLAPGAGEELGPVLGDAEGFGTPARRTPKAPCSAGTPEASATGMPDPTGAGGTTAWPGAG